VLKDPVAMPVVVRRLRSKEDGSQRGDTDESQLHRCSLAITCSVQANLAARGSHPAKY
jgi:hypothetical protein